MFRKLTESELEIMDYFWEDPCSISCNDILNNGGAERWSSGYLHNTIRSMLQKDVIRVTGQEIVGKVWARKFAAVLTREEYAAKFGLSLGIDKESVIYVILAMAQQTGNWEYEKRIKNLIKQEKGMS